MPGPGDTVTSRAVSGLGAHCVVSVRGTSPAGIQGLGHGAGTRQCQKQAPRLPDGRVTGVGCNGCGQASGRSWRQEKSVLLDNGEEVSLGGMET